MNNDLTAFEKIPVKIFNTSEQGSVFVAKEIAALIKLRQKEGKPCVLGLGDGFYANPVVCGIGQDASKGGVEFQERSHLQSGRILSDAARGASKLRAVYA